MQNKKIALFALATMGLVALASCGPNNPVSSESGGTEDSSEIASSNTSTTRHAEMTLKNSSIRAGMTFIDGAVPSTVYFPGDGSSEDYGTSGIVTITNQSTEEVYDADEPLPAGSYQVKNKLIVEGGRSVIAYADLAVTEGTIDQDKGVNKDVDPASMANYKFMNYAGIDTLGGNSTVGQGCMPSTGESRVLVIPVVFKNTKFGNGTAEDNDAAREILREAFFAKNDKTAEPGADGKIPDTTPWESLASYYDKASNGKLEITGEVTPVYTYNADDTVPSTATSGLAQRIVKDAINYFKNPSNESGYVLDATKFDSDKDGYIDGVEMVYVTSQPTPSSGGSDVWWNYTTYTDSSASLASPTAKRIFFSRWDFLTNGYYTSYQYDAYGSRWDGKAVDAHTIIHETGHMMGAPDYYSYAEKEGEKNGPAGCVDMMDQNVGDHNAYTKMAYGWVTPWVVDYSSNDFEVTLPSYTDTKKFLIVPASGKTWNGTPWDEYLLIEYYTPTGVNEEDSDGYPEWNQASSSGDNAYGHGGTYRRPGVQMFHVDTRASSFKGEIVDGKKVNEVRNYTDTPKAKETVSADGKSYESAATSVHSNTPAGSASGRPGSLDGVTGQASPFRELAAIFPGSEASTMGTSYYSTMGCMTNLFGLQSYYEADNDGDGEPDETYGDKPDSKYGGDFYSPAHHKNWYANGTKFNNGYSFPWTIQITEQTDESVTLHFVNNEAI